MAMFERYIGIDYSGAGKPTARLAGLQVYTAEGGEMPERVAPDRGVKWSRELIADYLLQTLGGPAPTIVGIDHAFSFPESYMKRFHIQTWDAFVDDFVRHWPTHERGVSELNTEDNPRRGKPDEFRVTDTWTSSAKSVFKFGVIGQVGPSSHAGIPWLKYLRDRLGDSVFLWPFDGFTPPEGRSVIAEVYPAIFKNRFSLVGMPESSDERDAKAVALWLQDPDRLGFLPRYFEPPLSDQDRDAARLEGWILGVA